MAFLAITAAQVDAESPLDDVFLDLIRTNFNDHESRILATAALALEWRVNGRLDYLSTVKGKYKRLDGSRLMSVRTLNAANLVLDYPGSSGTLEIDVRKYRPVNHLITSMLRLFTGSISSIAQIAPALATQAIDRSTTQIATQSISLFKAAINVSSIILLTSDATANLVRYNLASAPDSHWKVGDTVTFASCTTGANNISATLVRVNDDGGNNVVVANASGVAQTGAAGTCTLRAYAYNYTNPVSTEFTAAEVVTMAAHTDALSNGAKTIYAVNSSGNNIIVKDATGVIQAGAAGTADVNRWKYSFSSAASATDFVVGEKARMATHTTGANNGDFTLTAVNSGGNNVIVYNAAGVVQGGVAGTVNTCRWVYALTSNPSTYFSATQTAVIASATTGANNGNFTVKEVNRSGANNIVVYNTAGVAQAGAAGTVAHSRMVLSFSSDLSAIYTTASNVEVQGGPSAANNIFADVVAVNQGGGANYNVVIDNTAGVDQSSPAGRIVSESKSIFSTRPKIVFPTTGETSYNNTTIAKATTAGVIDVTNGSVSAAEVTANVVLGLDIISFPLGTPTGVTVQVS